MQTKNSIIFLIVFFLLNLFGFNLNLKAEEFDISASEIIVDKENNIVRGKGSVIVSDKEGKVIKADKVTYEKSKNF